MLAAGVAGKVRSTHLHTLRLTLLPRLLLQSGDYVINLCMWHRHMLPRKTAEERQQDQDKAGGSLDGLKRRWKGFFKGSS
jgi:hypothetical protein